MEMFLQCVFSGIAQGAIYGLLALGYSVIYSTMRQGHFAQGDFYMFGAYLSYQAIAIWALSKWVGVFIAMVGTSILMLIVERLVYRTFYTGAGTGFIMATMGMQYIIQEFTRVIWGSEIRKSPLLFSTGNTALPFIKVRVVLSIEDIMIIVICTILMLIVAAFMRFTKMGLAMSAVSMNRDAAQYMGVKLTTVIATTYIMAAALAAICGFLMGPRFSVSYTMGNATGSRAMIAAVLGGFGSMPGAMLGGVLLGVIEILCGFYITSAYRDLFTFIVLISILFTYPQGIMGRRSITKV